MKNTIRMAAIVLAAGTMFSACYTSTVDAVSVFDAQLPVHMTFEWRNRQAPDTSVETVDLNDYQVYRTNRDDIQKATAFQFAYWLDSLSGSPGVDDAIFPSVELLVEFPGDPTQHLLGRFENVRAADYYRTPHVIEIDAETQQTISTLLKAYPSFKVIQRIAKPTTGTGHYDVLVAKVDIAVRLEVEI